MQSYNDYLSEEFFVAESFVIKMKIFSKKSLRNLSLPLLLVYSSFVCSQSGLNIDSLVRVINSSEVHDTVRAYAYDAIANEKFYSDNDTAYIVIMSGKKFCSDKGLKRQLADFLSLEGMYYKNRGDFPTALKKQLESLKIKEGLNYRYGMAVSHNDIGILYKIMKQFNNALLHYRKSAAILFEIKKTKGYIMTLNNIGTIHIAQGRPDSALFYYEKAIDLAEKIKFISGLATAYNNMGEIYAGRGDFRKSKEYFEKCLEIDNAADDKFGMMLSYTNLGLSNVHLKDFKTGFQLLSKAEILADSNKAKANLLDIYSATARAWHDAGDDSKAYEYEKKYSSLASEISGEEASKTVAEMQVKYETEKKEKENLILQKESAEKDLALSRRNNIIVMTSGIFILVVVSGSFMYYRNKQKQQRVFDAEMLKQQQMRNKAIIEAEEKERVRIARDLHDGVGQMLSAAKLNLNSYSNNIKSDAIADALFLTNALNMIDDSVREVRAVSHNMMPGTLYKHGLKAALESFTEKINGTGVLNINTEFVGMNNRLDQTTELVIYRVLQEIVSNCIRHANATSLNLQLINHGKELVILAEDNGLGFDSSVINSIKGIGLKNIISRIGFLNGTVEFDSVINRGTTVIIEIPLN